MRSARRVEPTFGLVSKPLDSLLFTVHISRVSKSFHVSCGVKKNIDNVEVLSGRLAAIASPQRMRILAMLVDEQLHVSELARRLGMSRPLLYMHLTKLEQAGFVSGHLELSDDGKALKCFEINPFSLMIDAQSIAAAVAATDEG